MMIYAPVSFFITQSLHIQFMVGNLVTLVSKSATQASLCYECTSHTGENPSENQPFVIIQNFFDRNDPYIMLIQNFKIVVLG